jgi:hypothetical protein
MSVITKPCKLPDPIPIKSEYPFLIASIRKGEEKREMACGTDKVCLQDQAKSDEQWMFKILGMLLIFVLFSTVLFAALLMRSQ